MILRKPHLGKHDFTMVAPKNPDLRNQSTQKSTHLNIEQKLQYKLRNST